MKRKLLGSAAIATIFALGLVTGWTLSAGAQAQQRPVTQTLATSQQPSSSVTMNGLPVMTGGSLGVRIDGQAGAHYNGTLVVKVGSTWKEVSVARAGQ